MAAASTDHDVEFSPEEVSSAEVASFERIAAALVAKIEDIPDGKYHAMNCMLPCKVYPQRGRERDGHL